MNDTSELTLGYISYLNCVPFFYGLKDCGFKGRLVPGVPSELNRMLQTGELDISPSSSFEYALNFEDYLLLPNFSISSFGPVGSVFLFSPCPPEQLSGRTIAITGESATSINLLRVLLLEYYDLQQVDDYVPVEDVETAIRQGRPGLLIGDRAMKQAKNLPAGVLSYDLGDLWYKKTGLPFVFALWILRRSSAREKACCFTALIRQLETSLEQALNDLPGLARNIGGEHSVAEYVSYWQGMDFFLTSNHLAGLSLYFSLCHKHNLLAKPPGISFFSPS
ncbi:menaquinone biosynthetic enzyme MqnA/MqnD family protein [Pelobacter seleniigenes]|uniref:menaquinone biosynthetic enzyme MqnA/MqnD family protein n=1 Tax=Pelobacter seleniigenes TaxID=407188 RepID=UPI0004A716CE|nr:menaquinone biosynthesis protein [Pelobacter seleniigenes]